MDLVRQLGPMAFASRLKRLSDRLKADVTKLYHEQGVDFNASWFLVGYVLAREGSLTVTQVAEALGISRPAVSQISSAMVRHKLISIRKDGRDGRRRHLSLTKRGKKTIADLDPIWRAVRDCTAELLSESGVDVLEGLNRLEAKLDEHDMFERVRMRMSRVK